MRKKLLIYNLILLFFTTSCSTEKNFVANELQVTNEHLMLEIIESGSIEDIKELLSKKLDLSKQFELSNNLLFNYCSNKPKFEIVKLLLEKGAKLDIDTGLSNNSLMHVLALSEDGRDYRTFKLLLDYGENINAKNAYGDTPLISILKGVFDIDELNPIFSENYLREKQELLDSINFLIENGSDITIINKEGLSFVDYLIKNNLNDLAKKYLEKKEVLEIDKHKTQSYLETSIESNNITILNFLLDKNIYTSKYLSEKALIKATNFNKVDILKILIKNGADINFSSDVSFYLFKESINLYRKGNKDLLNFLIENKININYLNSKNETILLEIIKNNEKALYNFLLKNSLDINYINEAGENILLSFFLKPKSITNSTFNSDIIKLIDSGVNFNVKDNLGNNLFSYLIKRYTNSIFFISDGKYSSEKILKHLISKGLDVTKKFDSGFAKDKTPLRLASELRQTEFIKFLLENTKVDINEQDNYGDTALIVASRNRDLPTIKILLEHNPDISIKNKFGDDALSIVKRFDSNRNELTYIQKDIIELLEKYKKNEN